MNVQRMARAAGALALLLPLAGCVTVAEHRKLERRVMDMQRSGGASTAGSRETAADLQTRIDSLEESLRRIEGRIEVAEHQSREALEEAKAARVAAAGLPPGSAGEEPAGASDSPAAAGDVREGATAEEVAAYRAAYAEWRAGNGPACVDRFRNFLQTYPSSAYADDSAYWLADCYFKQGDYKTAILRFDDVVSRYPTGNKAADALYRQGEALLRLGPGYGKAAGKAFERVIREYPDSGRATEARRQLDLLGSS